MVVEVYDGPGVENYRSQYYSASASTTDGGYFSSIYVYQSSAIAFAYDGLYLTGATATPRNQFWVSGTKVTTNYFTIGTDSSASLQIKYLNGNISSVDIGPHKLNKQYSINSNILSFTINQNENLFIIVNNNTSCPIMAFANPLKPPIPEDAISYGTLPWVGESCIYFGPGVYDIGQNCSSYNSQILNNVKLYLDGGAYVKGSLWLVSSNNVSTIGPGILSCESWYDSALAELRSGAGGTADTYNKMYTSSLFPITARFSFDYHRNTNLPSGIYVDGITIVKFPAHGPKGLNTTKNLKLISPWEYSTDGPSIMPDKSLSPPMSKHDNMFIFNADDCVYIGAESWFGDRIYSGCYFVNSNNGPFANYGLAFDGLRTYGMSCIDISVKQFDDVRYETGNLGLFKITMASDNSSWVPPAWGRYNMFFSGINFEGYNYTKLIHIANQSDPFREVPSLYLSGAASGLIFKNITVSGDPIVLTSNVISGLDEINEPSDILFENVVINGTKLTAANMEEYFIFSGSTDPQVDNITFISDFPSTLKVSPIKLLN